jgi:putative ABC transport system permease protein
MLSDLRYALRAFARTPGFTLVAVLTLALGIGATTAIFSIVNAVLLAPLPYATSDRLVVSRGSLPDLHDAAQSTQSFDRSAIWATNLYNLDNGDETQQVLGGVVSPELMPLLGVTPAIGRNFTAEDDRSDTVILGYGLWQSKFGGDPAVLGRTIRLTGTSYTVIGVAPAWFRFPSDEFSVWTPLGAIAAKAPEQARNRSLRIFSMVARLRDGATLQQAQSEIDAVSARLAAAYPVTNANVRLEVVSLYERLVGDVQPALAMLIGAVSLLLLIACANVANLMLARTTVRDHEFSIRAALGAGRFRLFRQLAAESLVLAGVGGAIGVLVAMWSVDMMPALLEARLPRADGIRVDANVLLFALAATLLSTIFFGFAPALQTLTGRGRGLKEGVRGGTGTSRGRRMRRGIAVAEIALAVTVVVGAGLLARSFLALTARNPGFEPSNLIAFNIQLIKLPDPSSRARAVDAAMERLSHVPGVTAVGGATGFPIVTPQRGGRFEVEGRTLTGDQDGAYFIATTPHFFRALQTPLLRGRAFDANDRESAPRVVVINRRLANTVFEGRDPIGQRLRLLNPEQSNEWRTIVGVADDVHYEGTAPDVPPTIYTPFSQTPFLWVYVMVRTTGAPERLTASIRAAVRATDPILTAADVRTMDSVLSKSTAEPRLNMLLTSSFALVALVLAAVGIYGVITYSVAQRTREIGIRMALGATSRDVSRLVVGEGALMAAAGVAIGLVLAAVLMRSLSTVLFGVTARDPITYATGGLVLLAVAVLAGWLPARRAVRIEPVAALRQE